ncbi:MAG TPA: ADP-ribosylglycohydrolase family protein [Kiloniellales bacterium]|nr:ADP-ribosylglycohydrolase family protein [Kiloniellales bacterium]
MDPATRERALGAMLGLAVGDALGTTLEFAERDARPPLTAMAGGGPFDLAPGEWTDDTAMALALADSLAAHPRLDERDLMQRFLAWWQRGDYSHNGRCFDIGGATREALARFRRSGDPIAGNPDPNVAGNGSIMRLAPAVIANLHSEAAALEAAQRQGRTTHRAPQCEAGCSLMAAVLFRLLHGASWESALAVEPDPSWHRAIVRLTRSGWRGKSREAISSSGYVADTLEAAFWCVDRSAGFAEAVLLAANLGDDADTVAAVTGQLAGARWSRAGIPADWLSQLAWRERIEQAVERLLA